jgi:hypothetical protein
MKNTSTGSVANTLKGSATVITSTVKITSDLLIDVLRILFGNKINHKIESVSQKENIVQLQIHWIEQNPIHKLAKENLEDLVTTYNEEMEGLLSDTMLFMNEAN